MAEQEVEFERWTAKRKAAVVQNHDGRLEVFARATWSQQHNWQQELDRDDWSGWQPLGGLAGQWLGPPAVGRNHDGGLKVFITDRDRAVRHIWQVVPGGRWFERDWQSMGKPNRVRLENIIVGQNHDGGLEVLARGQDGGVYNIWQDPI